MSINRACISGNLTRDAELRQTAGGLEVLSFSVAVNERRKNNQTGEWEDYPNYIECTMFGARAGKLAQYLLKGCKVSAEGRLRQSRWQDRQTGQNRSKVSVVVDEIEFLNARREQDGGQYQPTQYQQTQAVQPTQGTMYDQDMPF